MENIKFDFSDFGIQDGELVEDEFVVDNDTLELPTNTTVTQTPGAVKVEPTIPLLEEPLLDNEEVEEVEDTTVEETPSQIRAEATSPSVGGGNIAIGLAKALADDGILTVEPEDLKSVKSLGDLSNLIKKTIEKNEYSGLTDEHKALIEAVRNGMPLDRATAIHNNEVVLNSITQDAYTDDPSDDDNTLEQKANIRRQLIYEGHKAKGYDDVKAKRLTERAFKTGEDTEEAQLMHDELKAVWKQRKEAEIKAIQDNQKKQLEALNELKTKVASTKEVLPGIPVDSKMMKQVADMLTTPTGRDSKTNQVRWAVTDKRNENPQQFDLRLAYLIKMGIFDEKPDLSIFNKVKTSSAIEQLEKTIGGRDLMYDSGKGFTGLSTLDTSQYDILDKIKF